EIVVGVNALLVEQVGAPFEFLVISATRLLMVGFANVPPVQFEAIGGVKPVFSPRNIMACVINDFSSDVAAALLAFCLALESDANTTEAKRLIMATTTRSSINVKPNFKFPRELLILFIIKNYLLIINSLLYYITSGKRKGHKNGGLFLKDI